MNYEEQAQAARPQCDHSWPIDTGGVCPKCAMASDEQDTNREPCPECSSTSKVQSGNPSTHECDKCGHCWPDPMIENLIFERDESRKASQQALKQWHEAKAENAALRLRIEALTAPVKHEEWEDALMIGRSLIVIAHVGALLAARAGKE